MNLEGVNEKRHASPSPCPGEVDGQRGGRQTVVGGAGAPAAREVRPYLALLLHAELDQRNNDLETAMACLSTGKAGVPYNPAASTSMARARAKRAGTHRPAFPLAVPVGKAGWCVLIRTPCAIARCEAGGVSARWTRFPGFRVSYTLPAHGLPHSGLVSAHARYSCGNSSFAAFLLSKEVLCRSNWHTRKIPDVSGHCQCGSGAYQVTGCEF